MPIHHRHLCHRRIRMKDNNLVKLVMPIIVPLKDQKCMGILVRGYVILFSIIVVFGIFVNE